MEFNARIEKLRTRGAEFAATLTRLESLRPALAVNRQASADLQKFLAEGKSLKQAIRAATQMIDAGKKWIDRTFQTDAVETIPFAPEIIATTAASAVSAIEHFQERANAFLGATKQFSLRYEALPPEKKAELAGLNEAAPVPVQVRPAMILLALLGGAFAWYHFSGKRETEPEEIE